MKRAPKHSAKVKADITRRWHRGQSIAAIGRATGLTTGQVAKITANLRDQGLCAPRRPAPGMSYGESLKQRRIAAAKEPRRDLDQYLKD